LGFSQQLYLPGFWALQPGNFALPQIPLDLFGQAITGLSYLNASNFVGWLAVLFVFFVC